MNSTTTRILGIGAAILVACAGLATPALAQQSGEQEKAKQENAKQENKVLQVGDPAPKMQVAKFVKGKPVEQFEKGHVYVVEFWATWCGPCKVSIPHLTDVQKEYKDKGVTVIGVSVWEQGEALSAVEKFVETMGSKMDYTVAYDGDRGSSYMAENWMAAAKQNGIPAAFIVDKQGKIAWIGHPMDGMDEVLAKVVDGTWDPAEHAKKEAKKASIQKQAQKIYGEMQAAHNDGDMEKALTKADELIALDPQMMSQIAMMKFDLLLTEMQDYKRAYAYGAEMGNMYKDNSMILNAVAWTIVDTEGLKERDLDLAQRLATRANELTKGEDAAILDTVAHVHFAKGEVDKAIEVQEKAVAHADADLKAQLQAALDRFKSAKK